MTTINSGEVSRSQFDIGKPKKINVNAACSFEIKTSSGSVIEGVITPNNPLTITSQGDLLDINVYITDDSIKALEVV
ncbi:hypothetical protein ACU5EH_00855 [Aliivibrio salmonicida]|uniref:hypothetical protein n=1 Tax=Aliivibrio salmonicida TaxID=40269 RepID=UPI00406CB20A